jgi:hypothetical protein
MNNFLIYRVLLLVATIVIPIVFGWWLFIPIAFLYTCIAKLPYEIVLAGFILDVVYYFGDGFIRDYALTLFSLILVLLVWFLDSRIYWRKFI